MTIIETYRLNRELPRYKVGSIIYHEYEILPSKFNSGTYKTEGSWYMDGYKADKSVVSNYVGEIIERAVQDNNVDTEDWTTLLEAKEIV